ncbi:hypothetical protein M422DRAFT_239119 [Sphaerobolus stellatus SS14]|nr:hypothetical protein M422DRAFT_239119 [Sphaerobolus stellatus SS14]
MMKLIIVAGSGLAYPHSDNIIHDDIRATSVIVNEEGSALLSDPGLYSMLEKSPLIVNHRATTWTAPELLIDPPSLPSFESDTFAFTMTSMEVWTGQRPFVGVADDLVPSRILQSQRPDRPADVGDPL